MSNLTFKLQNWRQGPSQRLAIKVGHSCSRSGEGQFLLCAVACLSVPSRSQHPDVCPSFHRNRCPTRCTASASFPISIVNWRHQRVHHAELWATALYLSCICSHLLFP